MDFWRAFSSHLEGQKPTIWLNERGEKRNAFLRESECKAEKPRASKRAWRKKANGKWLEGKTQYWDGREKKSQCQVSATWHWVLRRASHWRWLGVV
jgi:hypothetical protein